MLALGDAQGEHGDGQAEKAKVSPPFSTVFCTIFTIKRSAVERNNSTQARSGATLEMHALLGCTDASVARAGREPLTESGFLSVAEPHFFKTHY